MYFSRNAGLGLFVVEMKTKLSIDYLKHKETILYKYVVFSHQSEAENPYEFLYGAPHGGGLTNRALRLPYNSHSPGGQYIYLQIIIYTDHVSLNPSDRVHMNPVIYMTVVTVLCFCPQSMPKVVLPHFTIMIVISQSHEQ